MGGLHGRSAAINGTGSGPIEASALARSVGPGLRQSRSPFRSETDLAFGPSSVPECGGARLRHLGERSEAWVRVTPRSWRSRGLLRELELGLLLKSPNLPQ